MLTAIINMTAMIVSVLRLTMTTDGATIVQRGPQQHEGSFEFVQFLGLLGLDGTPKVGKEVSIPDFMLGLYRQSIGKSLSPGMATRSIKLEGDSSNCSSSISFRYDLSSLSSDDVLTRATVRLTNVFGPNARPSLLFPSTSASGATRVLPLPFRQSYHHSLVFPVTQEVVLCRQFHFGNDIASCRNCSFTLEVDSPCELPGLDAILVLVTRRLSSAFHQQASPRSTRAVRDRKPTSSSRGSYLCHRKEMYVDFVAMGWDKWVIAPTGYSAFYCDGSCPFPISEHLNTTNHAIMQTLAHSVQPQEVASTCCVPIHLAPISMLYYEKGGEVVLKQFNDMVVDACGCR